MYGASQEITLPFLVILSTGVCPTTCKSSSALYIFQSLSDVENEVTASIEKLLPINENAINTLRNLYGYEEAIKILNAILTDAGSCSAELTNMYEEQYHIYKAKALNNPYDYDTARKRIISAELFANYIEANLLQAEQQVFEQRLQNDLNEDIYRSEHFDDDVHETMDALDDYYDSRLGKLRVTTTPTNKEDGQ